MHEDDWLDMAYEDKFCVEGDCEDFYPEDWDYDPEEWEDAKC